MIEKINVKMIAIILVIIVLCIGVFITVKTIMNSVSKNYELEIIAEEDYKYFVVLTERKIWCNR